VRDGGVKGVVIRLSAKGFGEIAIQGDHRLSVGAAVPDFKRRGRRRRPASTASHSFAAFPGRSAAPCA